MEDKKKRGRPEKDGSRRNKIFSRCNDCEKADIERAARIREVSVAEFIRTVVREASIKIINEREEELSKRFGSNGGEDFDEYYYEDDTDDEYLG